MKYFRGGRSCRKRKIISRRHTQMDADQHPADPIKYASHLTEKKEAKSLDSTSVVFLLAGLHACKLQFTIYESRITNYGFNLFA